MPLDFPTSPADGDTYEQYKWSAADGVWQLNNPVIVEPDPIYDVQYVVVAGGGGGGSQRGGGGGAGGYRSSVIGELSGGNVPVEPVPYFSPGSSFTVTIGAGAAATLTGSDSRFGGILSKGGAGGNDGGEVAPRGIGGSGGGGGGGANNQLWGAFGIPTQGFSGGDSFAAGQSSTSGGGGAGAVGQGNVSTAVSGNGGTGIASSITGSSVFRAGGGGGSCTPSLGSTTPGTGGAGGGGNGGNNSSGTAGTANTGGGGGGGSNGFVGSAGGSGIVILKYPDTAALTIGAGLTSSTATVTGYKITTFTAGTGTVTIGPA